MCFLPAMFFDLFRDLITDLHHWQRHHEHALLRESAEGGSRIGGLQQKAMGGPVICHKNNKFVCLFNARPTLADNKALVQNKLERCRGSYARVASSSIRHHGGGGQHGHHA
jgi:hypothetical protein